MKLNVQLVYGAGNDEMFGKGLRALRDKIIAKFGNEVNVPRVIDFREYQTLTRLLREWQSPTILVGHSCGVQSITRAVVDLSTEPIVYLMGIAPSIFCKPVALPPNVARATQVKSVRDIFNPLQRQLIVRSNVNIETNIDIIESGAEHVESATVAVVHDRLLKEVQMALSNQNSEIA